MDWKGRIAGASLLVGFAAASHGCLLMSIMARQQIAFARQSNILIWDPATKTEHLVRSSALVSNLKQFDILIPTPSVPTVKPVEYYSYMSLYSLMHPKPEFFNVDFSAGFSHIPSKNPKPAPSVQTAQIARVGNLVATTIQASDVIALDGWLKKNGYKPNVAQNKWLEKYVQKRWYLTAFKVNTTEQVFETDAVRLSFKTEVPVNPYYAPERSWVGGIHQELYVVSPVSLKGYIGAKTPWKARTDSSAYLNAETSTMLAQQLKLDVKDLPKKAWVSRFVELSQTVSTPDDIYFYPESVKPVNPRATKKRAARLSQ